MILSLMLEYVVEQNDLIKILYFWKFDFLSTFLKTILNPSKHTLLYNCTHHSHYKAFSLAKFPRWAYVYFYNHNAKVDLEPNQSILFKVEPWQTLFYTSLFPLLSN